MSRLHYRPHTRREVPPTRALLSERVVDLVVWVVAPPPEFVLAEGTVLPIEERLS
jgi:hypothetical protein